MGFLHSAIGFSFAFYSAPRCFQWPSFIFLLCSPLLCEWFPLLLTGSTHYLFSRVVLLVCSSVFYCVLFGALLTSLWFSIVFSLLLYNFVFIPLCSPFAFLLLSLWSLLFSVFLLFSLCFQLFPPCFPKGSSLMFLLSFSLGLAIGSSLFFLCFLCVFIVFSLVSIVFSLCFYCVAVVFSRGTRALFDDY